MVGDREFRGGDVFIGWFVGWRELFMRLFMWELIVIVNLCNI